MTKHLLTEPDCDNLRTALLVRAEAAIGTPACAAWQAAVELLDATRSDSFLRRASTRAGLNQILPATRKSLGLRYTR